MLKKSPLYDAVEKAILTKGYFVVYGLNSESVVTAAKELQSKFPNRRDLEVMLINSPEILIDLNRVSDIKKVIIKEARFANLMDSQVEIYFNGYPIPLFDMSKEILRDSDQFQTFCKKNNRYDLLLKLQ